MISMFFFFCMSCKACCALDIIIINSKKTWMQFWAAWAAWTRVKHVGVGGTERATDSEKGLAVNAPCLFSVFCCRP